MKCDQEKQCSIVVAYDRQRGIGINNKLPWGRSLPADLQHFRQLTTGGTVIMGRKTYESIGRPLANRQNIVLTQFSLDGVATAGSLERALQLADSDEIFRVSAASAAHALVEVLPAQCGSSTSEHHRPSKQIRAAAY